MKGSTNAQRRDAVKTTILTVNGCSIIKREYGPMVSYSMQNQWPTTTGDFIIDSAETGLPSLATTDICAGDATYNVGMMYVNAQGQPVMRISERHNWTGFTLTLIREGGGRKLRSILSRWRGCA